MLKVDVDRWNQTLEDLQSLALCAEHFRTRERFFALHRIVAEKMSATAVAAQLGRFHRTVIDGVHAYNESGPSALKYQRSGGKPPLFQRKASKR